MFEYTIHTFGYLHLFSVISKKWYTERAKGA